MWDLNIRKAKLSDLSYIIDSIHNIFIFETKINSKISPKWARKNSFKADLANEIISDEYLILILEKNQKQIWILHWEIAEKWNFWNYKKFSYLNYIYIEEDFRKLWYWERLCNDFFNWAKDKWSDRVIIEAIPENLDAIKLYQNLWFSTHIMKLWKDL